MPNEREGFESTGLSRAEIEMREAVRAEAEEDERQAALLAMRRRLLSDVAREALHRGDRITAGFGDRVVSGTVLHAAGDLMTLEADGARVDFNLSGPVYLHVTGPATAGGSSGSGGPGSFRGRMLELEARPAEVALWSPLFSGAIHGRVVVAAADHVIVVDGSGREYFVPLSWISFVAHDGV